MSNDHAKASDKRAGVTGWVMRHPWVTLALAFLLALAAALFLLDRAVHNRLKRSIAEIAARGEPVTVADLIALDRPIPDEENMTVAVMKAARPILDQGGTRSSEPALVPLLQAVSMSPTGQRLPQAQLDEIKSFLDRFAGPIEQIHASLQVEKSWFKIVWGSQISTAMHFDIAEVRDVSTMLRLETALVAHEGNREAAAHFLIDACRLNRILENPNPLLIVVLVRIGMIEQGLESIERTINLCGMRPDDLKRIDDVIAEFEDGLGIALRQSLQVERLLILDSVIGPQAGNAANPITQYKPPGVAGYMRYLAAWRWRSVAEGLELLSMLINALGSPDSRLVDSLRHVDATRARQQKLGHSEFGIVLPSLHRAVKVWIRTCGSTRALRAALAAERFRLAEGHWPASLADLKPDYLDEVPLDPFDDKTIRYAIIPEGIKVWSIGDDEKDNGGDVRRLNPMPRSMGRSDDAGWIILNPELRGRPAGATTQASQAGE